MKYELLTVILGEDQFGKQITSCVCLPIGQKDAIRREEELKGARISTRGEDLMRAFFAAEKKHGGPVPVGWDVPARVRSVVPYEEVKAAFRAAIPSDDIPDAASGATPKEIERAKDAARKLLTRRLKDAREDVTKAWAIGFKKDENDKDWMWWTGKPLRAFPQTVPRNEPAPEIVPQADIDPDLDIAF